MLGKTHKIIARNIVRNISYYNIDIIDTKSFIKGNLIPDKFSTYKLKKHYKDESFDMIVDKINFLSSLSEFEIMNIIGKNKFSLELGVVCHFLSDYFCLAHEERWEFKKKFKSHVNYEIILGKISEVYRFNTTCLNINLDVADSAKFIDETLEEYKKVKGFEADLIFAQYVCNSIVSCIIKSVIANKYNRFEEVI